MGLFWLIAAVAAWGVTHSWLAALDTKAFFGRILGVGGMRYYRLVYNGFSVFSFLPILVLMVSLPDQPLYQVPAPWKNYMMIGQALAVLVLIVGVVQTGLLAFVGLGQLIEDEGTPQLVTTGLYRYVRHPLYSAGLTFLWLSPRMSVNTLAVYLAASIYLVVGALFEERKLLRVYGSAYRVYRNTTPMFIPGLKNRQNKGTFPPGMRR